MKIKHQLKRDELRELYHIMTIMNTAYAPTTQWVMAAWHWAEIIKILHLKTFESKPKATVTMTIPQACAFNIYMSMCMDQMGIYPKAIVSSIVSLNDQKIASLKQEVYYAPKKQELVGSSE